MPSSPFSFSSFIDIAYFSSLILAITLSFLRCRHFFHYFLSTFFAIVFADLIAPPALLILILR